MIRPTSIAERRKETQLMQRRHFIAGCSAALAAAAIEPPLWAAASSGASHGISRARFTALVGSECRLYANNRFVGCVRLEAVDDGPQASGLDQFTLRWQGEDSDRLAEGIYTVKPAGGPAMDLALEPTRSTGRPYYRSTFNLLV
jgi:hypothetical protein